MPTTTKTNGKNIPKLRFKGFSEEWEGKKLGDILSIGSGKDYKHLKNGDVPVYGTGGYMTAVDEFLYDGESVCIGRKGTIDKPRFISGKFWTVDTLFYTHTFTESVPKFVFLLFHRINWQEYNEASGVPSLSKTTIEKIKISIPTLPEQQKIATFLTAVDKKIELLTKKKHLLEQYKKGVMQQLFSQKIRFTGFSKEWEEKKLGEVCKLQGGYAFKSNKFKNEGIPIIRISNISNNHNFIESRNLIFYEKIKNDHNFIIKNGDLIIAMSGATTGKSSIYDLMNIAYLNQRVGLFKANKEKIDYQFLIQFVFSKLFEMQLAAVLVAGAQPNISPKDIEDFKLILPPLPEQQKIASFLTALDTKIEHTSKQIEKAKQWKKGLLQQMFV